MNNASFAKSILMILVILGHSFAPWTGWGHVPVAVEAPNLGHFANWFGTFHTYAFTLLSGFIYEYLIDKRGGYNSFGVLLTKKMQRLIIPFVAFSVLWVIPLTSYFVDIDSHYILNKFVLGKSPAQLWFLLMLFNVFVLFYPIRKLIEKSKLFYVIIPGLYVLGFFYAGSSYDFYQIFTSMKYLALFTVGHLMYKYRAALFGGCNYSLSHIIPILILVITHIVAYIIYLQQIPGITALLWIFLNFEGSIAFVALLLYVGDRINVENKFIRALQGNSFVMYLLHQQLIYYVIYYFNGMVCPVLNGLLNFTISFVLSMIISIILRQSRFVRIFCLGESK